MSSEVDLRRTRQLIVQQCPKAPSPEQTGPLVLIVVVPAYNEAGTISSLLDEILADPFRKRIVIVDDGSTDGTAAAVEDWRMRRGGVSTVELLRHPFNRGKGAAIRTGLTKAIGDLVIIQDADLEYDPADYPRLVAPLLSGDADVVYGSRYLCGDNHLPWTANRICVHLLNLVVRMLYGQRITDEATCYKVFRTDVLAGMDLRCERFEFCPEVTAKACRMGLRIHEVPIHYRPRTVAQGKKIRWWDGVEAIATLLYWRFAPFRPTEAQSVGESVPAPFR